MQAPARPTYWKWVLGGPPGCSLSSLAPDSSRCEAALGCGSFPRSSCHSQLPASRADIPGLFLLVLDLKWVLKKKDKQRQRVCCCF